MSRRIWLVLGALPLVASTGCFDPPEWEASAAEASGSSSTQSSGEETSGTTGGELCGNGELDGDEECDLGDANSDNGECTTACLNATCGDGLTQTGVEDCDDSGQSADCDSDCTAVECGDGVLNEAAGEVCEEGDSIDGGSCQSCAVVCDVGREDCDDQPDCEVDVFSDLDNCGGCGTTCDPGDQCRVGTCGAKLVFASDAVVLATEIASDLSGADALCTTEAAAAGFDGTFLAWVSNASTSPLGRFTQSTSPYVRGDGVTVADDWGDLVDGILDDTINLNASGGMPSVTGDPCHGGNNVCATVFTNTTADGTGLDPALNCAEWTDTAAGTSFRGGSMTATNTTWTQVTFVQSCDLPARIYCFEQ